MRRAAAALRERPAGAMALGTTASRVTGLLRTVVLASALGVTALGDAYNTANTVPNMVFQLVAGGLLSAALVPMLVQAADERERATVASIALTAVVAVAAAVALLLALFARPVIEVLTVGSRGRPGHELLVEQGTTWLRIFAPQVAFYAMSVAAVGIMTARRRLGLGASAPVLANLITIAGAVAFIAMTSGRATLGTVDPAATAVLGWSTTAGVAAMALVQLWGARRIEPDLHARFDLQHSVVQRLVGLGRWVFLYVAVNQIGLAVVISLTSTVHGGVSAYQWAFVLMQFPYAVVAVSIYSSAYPRFALAAVRSPEEVAGPVMAASRRANVLLLPAAAGLALIAQPVAVALVGPLGAGLVAAALIGFAVSLLPFSLFQLLTRTSYAFSDTRTPALVNIGVNAVNIAVDVLVVIFVPDDRARLAGLALGYAASYVAGCVLLGGRLGKAGAFRWRSLFSREIAWAGFATASMAMVLVTLVAGGAYRSRADAVFPAVGLAAVGAAVFGIVFFTPAAFRAARARVHPGGMR